MVLETLDDTTLLADSHHEVSYEDKDIDSNEKCGGNGGNSCVIDTSEVEESEVAEAVETQHQQVVLQLSSERREKGKGRSDSRCMGLKKATKCSKS